ncbi:hypothetical protein M0805_006781 [Coniferiporia weirii]|nr:hypothetical protein M0805_006781 [Coniferiporia weirii]
MFRQDVDPLADTVPPRYAYESDEEDERADFPIPTPTSMSASGADVDVKITLGANDGVTEGETLIVASGEAGAVWARGAALGEQVGQVSVDGRVIGLVFRPSWAAGTATVIVSEALVRLPVWVMHPYAEAVLSWWKPSGVVILDAYSTATYISPAPIPHHEAPLRYLSTSPASSDLKSLSPFAPPNLLQTTSAAFLTILALHAHSLSQPKSTKADALAILVPSRRAPKPAPHLLDRDHNNSFAEGTALSALEDSEGWDPAVVRAAHSALQLAAGCKGSTGWLGQAGKDVAGQGRRRRAAEMEGSMYI